MLGRRCVDDTARDDGALAPRACSGHGRWLRPADRLGGQLCEPARRHASAGRCGGRVGATCELPLQRGARCARARCARCRPKIARNRRFARNKALVCACGRPSLPMGHYSTTRHPAHRTNLEYLASVGLCRALTPLSVFFGVIFGGLPWGVVVATASFAPRSQQTPGHYSVGGLLHFFPLA